MTQIQLTIIEHEQKQVIATKIQAMGCGGSFGINITVMGNQSTETELKIAKDLVTRLQYWLNKQQNNEET